MSTISDLQLKIGADSSGLQKELNKVPGTVKTAFKVNPVKDMQSALEGTMGSLETLIGKFGGMAALAASGFGLTNLIKGAVEAGNRTYELAQRLQITNAEAAKFSRILKLTGGDSELAGKAFMRLDSTIKGSGEAAEKTRAVLSAVGVTLTDQNGKLLPLNDQLAQLAAGYQKASQAGYAQEFIMNTLGARGLTLVKTLQNYNEASENAAKIKGLGLDAKQMHEISVELDVVQAQLGQLAIAGGAILAPVAKEVLPPILEGLSSTAKYIAENKENLLSLTKTLVAFTVAYKTLQALQKAKSAMGSLASIGTGDISEDALTVQQEKSIARRIKNIEKAAMAEEKAYLKTLSTAQMTDAEKEASYSKYCVMREAKAAETARVEAARMTAAYQEINMQARQSAAVQASAVNTAAGAHKVAAGKMVAANTVASASNNMLAAEQTAVTVATQQTGKAAVDTGIRMSTAARGSLGPLRQAASAVWALAGGWLGVAAAIVAATYKLYEFHQEEKREAENAQYVNVNGKDYYYSEKDNTMIRVKENGTRMNVYSQKENDEAKAEWDKKYAAANENSKKLHEKYGDETNIDKGTINSQIEALKAAFESGTSATKDNTKAIKESKTYQVEAPIGQEVVNIASRHPEGEQWMSPLVEDARVQCAAFVSALYQEAGIQGLNSINGNQLVSQFGTAYHTAGTGYVPQEGDMIDWKDHVGIYAGNGEYIARNSTGGVHRGSMSEANQWFGNPLGYGSISEYTGGKTVTLTTDEIGKKANEALRRLNQAKEEAIRLFSTMQESIDSETEGAYMSGMNKLAEDIRQKQEEINKLSNAGIPKDAVEQLQKQLNTYGTVMKQKLTDTWTESWNKIKTETKQIGAELTGDFKALADAEYEATVNALNKERTERLKEVSKNKEDKEAMVAVEEWYTAKTAEAAKKRTDAYRESFEKQAKYAIDNHRSDLLRALTSSRDGQDYMNWKGQTEALETYLSVWKTGHESMQSQIAELAESSTDKFQEFFQSILTGSETLGDSLYNLITGIGETILQQITQQWAGRLTESLFGGSLLGGGNNNNNSTGGTFDNGMNTMFDAFKNNLSASNVALGLFSGSTQKGGMVMGAYNVIQNAINTGTKPTEVGATVTATGALAAFTTAVGAATTALQLMSAKSGFGFGILGHATGGLINGPGTATSDSIPAWLSNGEYVLNADAVRKVGLPLLNAINSGRMPRFAKGGAVKTADIRNVESTTITKGGNRSVYFNISALDPENFMDLLRNSYGDKIRQYLFDNSRDFATESGLF
ncbi:MAG: hypothetical protein ACLTJQ_07125 [Dialister invisus]|uniref:hypothetical protein n=1 Tax=Dialister invisus TaxID=218538 RepID=UPI0039940A93